MPRHPWAERAIDFSESALSIATIISGPASMSGFAEGPVRVQKGGHASLRRSHRKPTHAYSEGPYLPLTDKSFCARAGLSGRQFGPSFFIPFLCALARSVGEISDRARKSAVPLGPYQRSELGQQETHDRSEQRFYLLHRALR